MGIYFEYLNTSSSMEGFYYFFYVLSVYSIVIQIGNECFQNSFLEERNAIIALACTMVSVQRAFVNDQSSFSNMLEYSIGLTFLCYIYSHLEDHVSIYWSFYCILISWLSLSHIFGYDNSLCMSSIAYRLVF